MSMARKWLDKLMHKLGYVRWDKTIQGEIKLQMHEQPFVDLKLPGGNSVCGWVDSRFPGRREMLTWADPFGASSGMEKQQ